MEEGKFLPRHKITNEGKRTFVTSERASGKYSRKKHVGFIEIACKFYRAKISSYLIFVKRIFIDRIASNRRSIGGHILSFIWRNSRCLLVFCWCAFQALTSCLVCPDIVQLSWQRPLFTGQNGRGLGLLGENCDKKTGNKYGTDKIWQERIDRRSHFCQFETTEIEILAFPTITRPVLREGINHICRLARGTAASHP